MTVNTIKSDISKFLATQSHSLTKEISSLLDTLDFDYNENCGRENVAAIKFEYEFSSFDIVAYPLDKQYNVIGDIKILLAEKQYAEFFPDDLEEAFLRQVIPEERSGIEKELREYKYKSFEDWFADCWNKAKGDTHLYGFLSFHDTMWVTNLATGEKVREDTIPALLQ
jgi:hypothetical protein